MKKQEFIHLAIGAFLGTILRIEITNTTNQYLDDGVIPKDIIDNFLGCFVIGFYNDQFKGGDINLHLAISTGFCGCLTTFSSWLIQAVKLAAINKFFDCSMNLFIGTLVAYSGLKLGQTSNEQLMFFIGRKLIYITTTIIIMLEITLVHWTALATALLAPIGAFARYHLSKLNVSSFPYGTLACNIFAVCIASTIVGLITKHTELIHHTIILKGMCGSLSTVSTWIKELCSLKTMECSVIYCWTSLLLCLYLGCLIYQIIII